MWRNIFKASVLITAGILAGRLAGLLREVILASTLGVSRETDIAVLVLVLPDLFAGILIGGGMNAVLIPKFKEMQLTRKGEAQVLFQQASLVVGILFALLTVIMMVFAVKIVKLMAPGFDPDNVASAVSLIEISVWGIPFAALALISVAYLHAHNRFGIASLGSLIFNIVIIGVLILAVRPGQLMPLAFGVILASGIRWITQIANLLKMGVVSSRWRMWHINGNLMKQYFKAFSAVTLLLTLPLMARAFATIDGPGSLAALNYSMKLIDFAAATVATVLAVSLYPTLSEKFSSKQFEQGNSLSRQGLCVNWIMTLPVTLILLAFSAPLVKLLFGYGAMDQDGIAKISQLTALMAVSLPAQGIAALLLSVFTARGDMSTPFRISIIAVLMYLILGWISVHLWGLPGLVIVGVVFYWGLCVAYIRGLRKKHGFNVFENGLSSDAWKILGAALIGFSPVALISLGQWASYIDFFIGVVAMVTSLIIIISLSYRNVPSGLGLIRILTTRKAV